VDRATSWPGCGSQAASLRGAIMAEAAVACSAIGADACLNS
jgi:hypothetical protein